MRGACLHCTYLGKGKRSEVGLKIQYRDIIRKVSDLIEQCSNVEVSVQLDGHVLLDRALT